MAIINFTPPSAADRGKFFTSPSDVFRATPAAAFEFSLGSAPSRGMSMRNIQALHTCIATVAEGLLERITIPYQTGTAATLSLNADLRGDQNQGLENLLHDDLGPALRLVAKRDAMGGVKRFLSANHWQALLAAAMKAAMSATVRSVGVGNGRYMRILPPSLPVANFGFGSWVGRWCGVDPWFTTSWHPNGDGGYDNYWIEQAQECMCCAAFQRYDATVFGLMYELVRDVGYADGIESMPFYFYVVMFFWDAYNLPGRDMVEKTSETWRPRRLMNALEAAYHPQWPAAELPKTRRLSLDCLWACQAALGYMAATWAAMPAIWSIRHHTIERTIIFYIARDGTPSRDSCTETESFEYRNHIFFSRELTSDPSSREEPETWGGDYSFAWRACAAALGVPCEYAEDMTPPASPLDPMPLAKRQYFERLAELEDEYQAAVAYYQSSYFDSITAIYNPLFSEFQSRYGYYEGMSLAFVLRRNWSDPYRIMLIYKGTPRGERFREISFSEEPFAGYLNAVTALQGQSNPSWEDYYNAWRSIDTAHEAVVNLDYEVPVDLFAIGRAMGPDNPWSFSFTSGVSPEADPYLNAPRKLTVKEKLTAPYWQSDGHGGGAFDIIGTEIEGAWPATAVFNMGYVGPMRVAAGEKLDDNCHAFALRYTSSSSGDDVTLVNQRPNTMGVVYRLQVGENSNPSAGAANAMGCAMLLGLLGDLKSGQMAHCDTMFSLITSCSPSAGRGANTGTPFTAKYYDADGNEHDYGWGEEFPMGSPGMFIFHYNPNKTPPNPDGTYFPYMITCGGTIAWEYRPDHDYGCDSSGDSSSGCDDEIVVDSGTRIDGTFQMATHPECSEGLEMHLSSEVATGVTWRWKAMPCQP